MLTSQTAAAVYKLTATFFPPLSTCEAFKAKTVSFLVACENMLNRFTNAKTGKDQKLEFYFKMDEQNS